ncbi:MAG: 30S ribosomal protein S6 [Patescibacteria group bacterium]|nr:30S ribosomal protein S6 [Patescibacteria group bacterium]
MYEIAFVLRQEDLSEIRKILEKNKADIVGEEELKKVRLSYPIKKQNYGFLGVFRFKVDPEHIRNMFSDMKLAENIIRYMINKIKTSEVEKRGERKLTRAVPISRREPLKAETRKSLEPVLTNEDLEKKIEEISQ